MVSTSKLQLCPTFWRGFAKRGAGEASLNPPKLPYKFVALGATVIEGNGSRVTFLLNDKRADFHRPHPGNEALRYRVKAAREFLELAGVLPNEHNEP